LSYSFEVWVYFGFVQRDVIIDQFWGKYLTVGEFSKVAEFLKINFQIQNRRVVTFLEKL
jgi:hypothetical protein